MVGSRRELGPSGQSAAPAHSPLVPSQRRDRPRRVTCVTGGTVVGHHADSADSGDSVLVPGLPVFAVACAYVIRNEFRGVNRRRLNAHDPCDAIEATLGDFGLAATWSAEHPPPEELAAFCSRDGEVARVSAISPVNRPSYDFAVLVYKGCFVWAHRL